MAILQEIIRSCKRGNKDAIKVLYQESCGWMLGVALRYIRDRNEAMSVVNLSILKAIENLKKFDTRKEESIEAWLKTILVRRLIDYQRKVSRDGRIMDFEPVPQTRNSVSQNGENTRSKELREMINALPAQTKIVFNLYAIEGYKHREIAEMLTISEGTSKWHLSDARKKLQEMLKKMDAYQLKDNT